MFKKIGAVRGGALKAAACVFMVLAAAFFAVPASQASAEETGKGASDAASRSVSEEYTPEGRSKLIAAGDAYGPVDLSRHIDESLKLVNRGEDSVGKDKTVEEDSRAAEMYGSLIANNWMITRALVWGFTGLDEAADRLSDAEELKTALAEKDELRRRSAAGTNLTPAGLHGSFEETGYSSELASAESKRILEENQKRAELAASLSEMSGVKSGDSIYDRIVIVAYMTVVFTFLIRLAQTLWSGFTGTEQHLSAALAGCILKFIVCLLCIVSIKWAVAVLLTFSELIRNIILSINSGGADEDVIKQMQALGTARSMIASASASGGSVFIDGLNAAMNRLLYLLSSAIVYVMVLLGDVMMGATACMAPLFVAVSMVKSFERWNDHVVVSIVQFALYLPIAAIYMQAMCIVYAVSPDMGFLAYLTIGFAFLLGATKIPNLAESMSGAASMALVAGFLSRLVKWSLFSLASPVKKIIGK